MMAVLKRDHQELSILSSGAIGTGHWVLKEAIETKTLYKVYLPCGSEIFSKFWKDEQISELQRFLSSPYCRGMFTHGNVYTQENIDERNKKIIEDCNILIVFWLGRMRGETYNSIKHALNKGKQVFNAYDESVVQLEMSDLRGI